MKKSEVTLMGGIDNNGLTRNNNSKKIILDLCGGTGVDYFDIYGNAEDEEESNETIR